MTANETRFIGSMRDEIIAAVEADDNLGICVACGFQQGGCEPDARGYKCEACGERKVYGAEELLFQLPGSF